LFAAFFCAPKIHEEGIKIAKKHRKFDFDPETMIATTTYDTDSITADKEAYLLWVEKQLNEEFGEGEQ
jgi:hypothetical protein